MDNFGFRYFDWDIGRFIQRDPSGYPDGLNNYLYCSNNPINRIDPLGLKKIKDYEDDIKKEREATRKEQEEYMKKSRKDADYDNMTKEEYLQKEKAGLTKIEKKHQGAIKTAQLAIDHIKAAANIYHDAVIERYKELKEKYGNNIPKEELESQFAHPIRTPGYIK